ncbi:MATE family efflux transporter [Bifidobacterium simiarum]|uniref:Multidrug export protein MepA n=1 Tax=Bifidobacterium simiarum TaxID=2045441 RepID=A0A2M9HFZ7_9BIFI|nr:MATE family efflux transporter [Bifidobacterium simiarum]MBT1166064.1 MATE family efflux transporter [Bifidobacterium simiarum]PJM75711.1 MATE family efflux transporter [Bifidobacterium simiarum]
MTGRPIRPLIIRLAIPAMISNLVTMAYNLVDTYFIGRLGTSQSGAIGIAFSVMTIMQAIGFFFGNGAGNSMSREMGKQNTARASRLMAIGFFGSVGFGTLLAVLGLLFLHPMVFALGSTETIAPYAMQYLTPILVAAPMVCGSFTMNGLLRYQGQSSYSMIGLVSGAILNCVLAPIFIFALDLGILGAGLATAVCQTISFTMLAVMCRKVAVLKLTPREFRPDPLLIREVIGGGLPSLLRQSVGSVAVTCVNLAANPFGDAAIAAMAIVMRLMMFTNSVIIGLGQGFQPVCGYNYGAGLFDRVRQGYWFCVRVSTVILIGFAIGLSAFAPQLIELFRSDPQVVRIGTLALWLQCCSVPFMGVNMISNMMQQTMGLTGVASFLGVCRQGVYLVPLIIVLPAVFGLLGVEIAQPAADLLTFATTIPLQARVLKRLRRPA